MTKRIVSVLLAALLLLSVSASAETMLEKVQAKGELVFATEGCWSPWTYHDESDKLVGFDVEVSEKISEKLGVAAKFAECEWDGIFAGLESGRYDLAANGVEVTEERSEKYNFTTPYCYIHTALIVRDDNTEITCFEDLNGKKTANSLSSTYEILAQSYGANSQGVDTLDQTIAMVLSGRVDATLNAEVSFYDYMAQHPDAPLKIVALTEEASSVAIPVRKGEENESMLEALNTAIDELRAEGVLSELSIKYFGSDIAG